MTGPVALAPGTPPVMATIVYVQCLTCGDIRRLVVLAAFRTATACPHCGGETFRGAGSEPLLPVWHDGQTEEELADRRLTLGGDVRN